MTIPKDNSLAGCSTLPDCDRTADAIISELTMCAGRSLKKWGMNNE